MKKPMHTELTARLVCLLAVGWSAGAALAVPVISLVESSRKVGQPVVVNFSGVTKKQQGLGWRFLEGKKTKPEQCRVLALR